MQKDKKITNIHQALTSKVSITTIFLLPLGKLRHKSSMTHPVTHDMVHGEPLRPRFRACAYRAASLVGLGRRKSRVALPVAASPLLGLQLAAASGRTPCFAASCGMTGAGTS